MAMVEDKSDDKVWGLFKLPFHNSQSATSSSSTFAHYQQNYGHGNNNSVSDLVASIIDSRYLRNLPNYQEVASLDMLKLKNKQVALDENED
ncbi:hypothetical protein BUALT_Bualt03G0181000 [Buddleja alternifolia]|uniref:Uncharacterized protein n=1 Tax=Buddleja alternifolia TaxID=168488 RepID=A0AAV6Y645_9LAMI|nr:hypothetical protein BUALT_Bualt03G0181000 [Buddleja alternifolia]